MEKKNFGLSHKYFYIETWFIKPTRLVFKDGPDGGGEVCEPEGEPDSRESTEPVQQGPDAIPRQAEEAIRGPSYRLDLLESLGDFEGDKDAARLYVESIAKKYPDKPDIQKACSKAAQAISFALTKTQLADACDVFEEEMQEIFARSPDLNPEAEISIIGDSYASKVSPDTTTIKTTEVRHLSNKERIKLTEKAGEVTKDKIAEALGIAVGNKNNDKKLVAAVREFQQDLWKAATPEDQKKFKRYKNAKGFGDGIWGKDTQALFEKVAAYAGDKYKDFKDKFAKLNPPAAPATAPAEGAPPEPATPDKQVAALPDLPAVSRPAVNNGPEKMKPKRSPDKYDEYTAHVGDILIMYKDRMDDQGNTLQHEGMPVIVTKIAEKKENKNTSLDVQTAAGATIPGLNVEDELDEANPEAVQKFINGKYALEKAAFDKLRAQDVAEMYDRSVIFITDATDDNGRTVKAGVEGISHWTAETGYTVTIDKETHRFSGIPKGQLPVKDAIFDSPGEKQYAKLKRGEIGMAHRGKNSKTEITTQINGDEVVLILGQTNNTYKVRTSMGDEGFIRKDALLENTRVARANDQTAEQVIAAVEAKVAPSVAAIG